ncbi:MAG TPA: ABC transporter substrate-binding protein [Chloroflexota bacterium]
MNQFPGRSAALAACALIPLAGCGAGAPAAPASSAVKPAPSASASAAGVPKDPLRAGYVSVSAYSTGPTITKGAGFFDKYNLDVNLTFISPPALTAALTAGKDMDVGYGSAESTATVDAQGGDLVIIGAMQQAGIFKISATPPIKSIADLRGKSVAITTKGSSTDLLFRQLAQQNNLVPDKDVSVVSIPEQPAMVAALKSGQVAAAVMSEPATSMAVAQGATVIYDQGKSAGKAVQLPVLLKRGYLASHRELLKRFLMANLEGIHFMKTKPAQAAPFAAAFLKTDDQTVVQKALEAVSQATDDDMNVPLQAVADSIKTSASTSPEVAKLKPEDIVDTSILQEIKASGFIDKLAAK